MSNREVNTQSFYAYTKLDHIQHIFGMSGICMGGSEIIVAEVL